MRRESNTIIYWLRGLALHSSSYGLVIFSACFIIDPIKFHAKVIFKVIFSVEAAVCY